MTMSRERKTRVEDWFGRWMTPVAYSMEKLMDQALTIDDLN
jgi:hypothetical protein